MQIERLHSHLIDRPRNPHRIEISEASIVELAKDIRDNGLTNLVCVRQVEERYEIIAGDRRTAAMKYLGWPLIECKNYGTITDEQCEKIRLSENIQREQLSPFEEAIQIAALYALHQHSPTLVAKACNRSESWVRQRFELYHIPTELQPLVHDKRLSIGAALLLNKITIDADRNYYTRLALYDGCSLDVLSRWVNDYITQKLTDPGAPPTMPDMPEPGQSIVVYLGCDLCAAPADTRTRTPKFICVQCQEIWQALRHAAQLTEEAVNPATHAPAVTQ